MAVFSAATCQGLKVGVISDMHTNLDYNPTGSEDDNCTASGSSKDYAPIARYGCDPSSQMVDYMLQHFKEVFGEVDVLLVPGDYV